MSQPPNVLFLCTGNSARSILAEALLNGLAAGRFRAYSAGSAPRGRVHPLALDLLALQGFATDSLRSKDLAEFLDPGVPRMEFVFTVCDQAAAACPIWPGAAYKAHWGVADPVGEGLDDRHAQRQAFAAAFALLAYRVRWFLDLPFSRLSPEELRARLREIGAAVPKEGVIPSAVAVPTTEARP